MDCICRWLLRFIQWTVFNIEFAGKDYIFPDFWIYRRLFLCTDYLSGRLCANCAGSVFGTNTDQPDQEKLSAGIQLCNHFKVHPEVFDVSGCTLMVDRIFNQFKPV